MNRQRKKNELVQRWGWLQCSACEVLFVEPGEKEGAEAMGRPFVLVEDGNLRAAFDKHLSDRHGGRQHSG